MSALPLQGQVTLNTIGLERARPGIASSQLFTKPQDSPFPQQGLQDPGVPAGNRGGRDLEPMGIPLPAAGHPLSLPHWLILGNSLWASVSPPVKGQGQRDKPPSVVSLVTQLTGSCSDYPWRQEGGRGWLPLGLGDRGALKLKLETKALDPKSPLDRRAGGRLPGRK